MFNYYVNDELIEKYPKSNPRNFNFGETYYIRVIDGVEDPSTRVDNTGTNVNDYNDYNDYDYKASRLAAYGEIHKQIEFITEHGLDAWQTRVQEIKLEYPKPEQHGSF